MSATGRTWCVLATLCILGLGTALYYKTLVRSTYAWIPRKFDSKLELFTATKQYSASGSVHSREKALVAEVALPPLQLRTFAIDDTDIVSELRGAQACIPKNFGYSVAAGSEIFPPYDYPDCASLLPHEVPALHVNATSFTLECPSSRSKYVKQPAGLLPDGHYLYTDLESEWKVMEHTGHPVSLGDSEYIFAACGDKFSQARYILRFNETVFKRAKETMNRLGATKKPMTILLLTVDSFSRRHFFRKLNHTVTFLNDLNRRGDYAVFDFKLHNVKGGNSVENVIPILSNRTLKNMENPPFQDVAGPGALWKEFKRLGYVTLVGFENCDYYFCSTIGRRLEADHVVRNFYCAATKLLRRSGNKNALEQRCIGEHMSHYYLLNYTNSFIKAYRGVNQFVSIHVDTAHEATGQHAVTLDSDLQYFLQTALRLAEENGHELVVFLQGDHGMRYGNWFKDVAAHQELKLPAFFLVASSKLLSRIPSSRETLWSNTFRLTSKTDVRASLLGLSMLAYDQVYPVHEDPYLDGSLDLFREVARSSRSCNDAGIEPWYCSCLLFEPIDLEASSKSGSLELALSAVAASALYIINRETNTYFSLHEGLLCQKLSFARIVKANGLNLDRGEELLQIEFTVRESDTMRFEVMAVIGSKKGSDILRLESDRYELLPLIYNGYQARVRVLGVERKDKYAGFCEVVARANAVKAEYCLCKDLDALRESAPGLFARLKE